MVEPQAQPHSAARDDSLAICAHPRSVVEARYGRFTLFRCETCDVAYSVADEAAAEPEALYEDFYRNEIGGRFSFGIEYAIRALRLFRAFKIFTLNPGARSVLDIGSGRGFMLYYLKKYFGCTTAIGTQISRPAVEFARRRLGLEIHDRDLLELPVEPERYDVVTIWHVLEHVQRPEEYLQRIFQVLKPGGCLAVEVPNYNSWTRKLTKQYWLGLDLDYHLYFFSPATLSRLLEKHGFRIEKIHTFSFEYSTFISAQSLVSWITQSDQVFFQWLQGKKKSRWIALHGLLFAALAPICFLINCFLYFTKRGEVLLIVARKP